MRFRPRRGDPRMHTLHAPPGAGGRLRWQPPRPSARLARMPETRPSLLRRVRDATDHRSWQEFYDLYEPLLLSYVRKRGLHGGDADDVVQTIFITLLRHLPEFEYDPKKGRFRTWLWRLSFTAVTDWRRKQARVRRVE